MVLCTDPSYCFCRHIVFRRVLHHDKSSSTQPLHFCKSRCSVALISSCSLSIPSTELIILLLRRLLLLKSSNKGSIALFFLTMPVSENDCFNQLRSSCLLIILPVTSIQLSLAKKFVCQGVFELHLSLYSPTLLTLTKTLEKTASGLVYKAWK